MKQGCRGRGGAKKVSANRQTDQVTRETASSRIASSNENAEDSVKRLDLATTAVETGVSDEVSSSFLSGTLHVLRMCLHLKSVSLVSSVRLASTRLSVTPSVSPSSRPSPYER